MQKKKTAKKNVKIPKSLSEAQEWVLKTPTQKYNTLSEHVTDTWMTGVEQVIQSQPDMGNERFENAPVLEANYFMWLYMLQKIGIVNDKDRVNIGLSFLENEMTVVDFLKCKISNDVTCEEMLIAGQITNEYTQSVLLKGLHKFHHILMTLSQSNLPIKATQIYVGRIQNVLSMKQFDVIPLSEDALDRLQISKSGHKQAIRTTSLVIELEESVANYGGLNDDYGNFGEDEL